MRRTYALFGIGLVLAAIVWLGLSAYIGAKAGQRMDQAFAPLAGHGLRSTITPERQDILGSTFVQDLEFDTGPLALFASLPPTMRLRLRHELAHGPVLSGQGGISLGLAEVKTTLVTEGTDWAALSALFGQPEILGAARLDTCLDFSGLSRSLVYLPEGLAVRLGGDGHGDARLTRLGKLNGWLARDGAGGLWYDFFMDRLAAQGSGLLAESQGLRWFGSVWRNGGGQTEGYLVQRVSKTGTKSLGAQDGQGFSSVSLDDDTAYALTADDQGYALRADRGISRLDIESVSLTEVKCRLLLSRIDPELLSGLAEALEPVAKRATRAAQAGEPQGPEARERLLTALLQAGVPLVAARPPRLDIREISALNPGGHIALSGSVWLDPQTSSGLSGGAGLTSGARAQVTVAMTRRFLSHLGDFAILAPVLEQLVAQGFVSDQQDMVESRLDYDGRAVLVNGKPLP